MRSRTNGVRNGWNAEEGDRARLQPSGQRIECVGQSKHGGVEFACDMERRASESVRVMISESGAGGAGGGGGGGVE